MIYCNLFQKPAAMKNGMLNTSIIMPTFIRINIVKPFELLIKSCAFVHVQTYAGMVIII
jgi:hypothetical protein